MSRVAPRVCHVHAPCRKFRTLVIVLLKSSAPRVGKNSAVRKLLICSDTDVKKGSLLQNMTSADRVTNNFLCR